jgi:hypothetical protein
MGIESSGLMKGLIFTLAWQKIPSKFFQKDFFLKCQQDYNAFFICFVLIKFSSHLQ